MALDRRSIEKKDFPIGRRGYDPDAVDSHLSAIAEEVEELMGSSRRRTETLASAAGEQVRAIVEAAENSGAEIQPPDEPADGGTDDAEGARLIALNMALNGTPREETDRYLADNFRLLDRHGLLDEVYASVEGWPHDRD